MNLFLAPIQGMTTAFYRNAFARIFGGIDAYYSPFIATTDIRKASPSLFKDLLPERNDSSIKIVPQLLGNNGADFKAFASYLVDMGYNEINWNIGCPFPVVTNKKKGSGILPYADMIEKFLDMACADSSYTLTVKMRLGYDDAEDGLRVIKLLNGYPLGGVIIHARTGIQMYTGKVDLDSFEILASACEHEVTYNGDIFTCRDFIQFNSRFPAIKNFMLGRGVLQDPFLPSAIKGRTVSHDNRIRMLRQFHDEIFDNYKNTLFGEKHLLDKMKELWSYLSVPMDKDGKLMKKIKKCNSSTSYLEIVNPILHSDSSWGDFPIR